MRTPRQNIDTPCGDIKQLKPSMKLNNIHILFLVYIFITVAPTMRTTANGVHDYITLAEILDRQ
jgi:hypothetical protein